MLDQIIPPPVKRHGVYSFVGIEVCFEWQQGESRYSILGGSTIKYEFISLPQ